MPSSSASSPSLAPPGNPLRDLLAWSGLFALSLAVYWPALSGAKLWDDPAHLTRFGLQSWSGLGRIWFEPGATQEYYPVLHSAFWLEHRLWGEAPRPYHVLNVLLHAASCGLLAGVLRGLWTRADGSRVVPRGAGWFAAALLAVHPVGVESVAWITEQKNTLSLFFYLLAGRCYLDFSAHRKASTYGWALFLFFLALGAKTMTVTLPAALLVLAWWQRGRLEWRRDVRPLVPWFVLALGAGLFTTVIEGDSVGANLVVPDLSLVHRTLLAARIFWFYLGTLLWPADLTFFYPLWDVPAVAAGWSGALVAGLGVTAGLWLYRSRSRGPLAAWLLYGGTLFPVLGFFKVFAFSFSYVADHFQYLAVPLALAALAAGLALIPIPARARLVRPVLAGLLILGLGLMTRGYSRLYRDDEILFRANIAANPRSWMGHHALAHAVGEDPARREEAIALYRAALRLKTDNPDSLAALGALLVRQPGQREEALANFQEAVRLRPSFAEAHHALANELIALPGRELEAIGHYETALQLRPRFGLARANLAQALATLPGRQDEALAYFAQVMEEMPDYAPAHHRLANLLAQLGRWPEAIPHYERALQLDPGAAAVHYDFARHLTGLPGRQDEALAHAQEAVRLSPIFVEAYNLLGVLHVRAGRTEEARAAWNRALELRPDFEPVRRNLRLLDQNPER